MRLVDLAALLAFAPSLALAQADDVMERGRARYLEGIEAFDEGRYAEAEAAFRESYELTRVPVALHNVATALRAMGRYADALAATRALLRDHEDIEPEVRDTAAALERELRDLVAIATLAGVPPAPVLRVDGEVRAVPERRPIELELDPGHHRLRVEAPERDPFEWAGTLAAGERLHLDVVLPARPLPPRAADDSWVWIVVGLAAAVAAGIAIGVGVHFGSQSSVYDDRLEI